MTETKIYCDFCKKETDNPFRYKLPCFVIYDAKDRRGNLIKSFTSNEIADEHKDMCPVCRKKLVMLLDVIPRTVIEEELS